MATDFNKIIFKFIKSKVSKNIKFNKDTKFDDIKEFDSLNFVQLIIFLNKYSIQIGSDKLSKIKKIKDLVNICEKKNR
jgi:acyl carrier protein